MTANGSAAPQSVKVSQPRDWKLIVECDIEIWPTCIVLKQGNKLRVDIQLRDGLGSGPYTHYHADYNAGAENTIHAGGARESYILLPIILAK